MVEPQKIRVLYFDESIYTLRKFIDECADRKIIDVLGSFSSFEQIAPMLDADDYNFLKLLSPDVIVLRIEKCSDSYKHWLLKLRKNYNVKLVGLLSRKCISDDNVTGLFDYCTEASGADNILSDKDVYTRLVYQIKTARLALNIEKNGLNGKWAILPIPSKNTETRKTEIIAIGASAGGTEAVSKILSELPDGLPPILVVQHIPENFTRFFSNNLSAKVAMKVAISYGGERLERGTVYIAGNDKHLEITKGEDGAFYTKCTHSEKVVGHRPSVDVLFRSVAKTAGSSAIGVILTGMGSDGAQGLLEMREAGAYTIGQDKFSSAVYGMPMVAHTIGAVMKQLPLNDIACEIQRSVLPTEKRGEPNE